MVDLSESPPSRSLLDEMMTECKLANEQKLEMHRSLGGIFNFVALSRSKEANVASLKSTWENKAKWNNFSYKALLAPELVDKYIDMGVDELLERREYQVKHLGHSR